MATNEPARLGRQTHYQAVHILYKKIAFDDPSLAGVVGILPVDAVILRGNVYVNDAFNTGTLNIGALGGDADEFASALALNAEAIVPFDELAIGNQVLDEEVTVTFARSTAQTAGEATIVIEYAVNNG